MTIKHLVTAVIPSVLILVAALVFAGTTWYESVEEEAVRATVGHYIAGAKTASAAEFEMAFAVEVADMKYVRKDRETGLETLVSVPISEAIESWANSEPSESWGKVVDVRILDDKLAHATVELLWEGYLYADVMSLYKVNGEWKIVNKTFVSRGKAE